MTWFKRQKAGITTALSDQNETPEGQWEKCPECSEIIHGRELRENLLVCPKCNHHFRIDSRDYMNILFDEREYELFDEDVESVDALQFEDRKPYVERLETARKSTGLSDAVRSAVGTIGGHRVSLAALDFKFVGGSMGSVVGEVVTRAIRRACEERIPLIIISQSGGARMMEGALSLMQMAKTSANLTKLANLRLPYISVMTDPTTGGVTASFAMLGDFQIAEPGALIGFAGPRVIRETMGQDLPDAFQRAEFLERHGFLDDVVDRRELRDRLIQILSLVLDQRPA